VAAFLFPSIDVIEIEPFGPGALRNVRPFCVFPRNLAPVFTHYLTERPEMNPPRRGFIEGLTKKGKQII